MKTEEREIMRRVQRAPKAITESLAKLSGFIQADINDLEKRVLALESRLK